MAAVVTAEAPHTAGTPPKRGKRRRWTTYILPTYSVLVIVYLLVPISIMILYSFNASHSHLPTVTFTWQGFTTLWYQEWNQVPGLTPAFFLSIKLALLSMVVATAIGTPLAMALARYRFRGKGASEQFLFLNIAAPEIVLGASLLGFLIQFEFILRFVHVAPGFSGLLVAHVMFSIAYVTITVRARLAGFDRSIEQAAQDLGATPWVTFWKVTLPLIFPGVLAGALLAFALSIDDFVTSVFVSGTSVTFPLWVYGAVRVGIPPQVFVFGTFIFTVGVILAATNLVFQGRKATKATKPPPKELPAIPAIEPS
jgi:spermidine/putrescine transport system permease protein